MSSLLDYGMRVLIRAKQIGFTSVNPVEMIVNGINATNTLVERKFIVSEAVPALGIYVDIWYQPSTWQFKKNSIYKNPVPSWEDVLTEFHLFNDVVSTGGGDFEGGTLTQPLYLSPDPIVADSQATSKEYVDEAILAALVGGGTSDIGTAVQTIHDLKALNTGIIPDKQIRLVEDVYKIYSYDAQSVATPDNEYVVLPNSGIGRWHMTINRILYSGTF